MEPRNQSPSDIETRRNARTPQRTPTTPSGVRPGPAPRGGPGGSGLGATPPPLSRPGIRPGEDPNEYDKWWGWVSRHWINEVGFDLTNPEIREYIKRRQWELGIDNPDTIITISSELERRGFKPTLLTTTPGGGSGSYRYGGGGGGGMSTEQQLAQAEAAVRNLAASLGAGINDDSIRSLAKVVVDKNWSNDMLTDYLVGAAVTNTSGTGAVTTGAADIKKLANDQLLTISDATAREWAGRIASNEMSIDDVRTLFSTQARQRYGWAAESIDAGLTVRDVLLPSRDRLASELELSAEDINLMDSKWLSMVQTTDDKGQTRAASDSEIIMRARKQPEWASTRSAAGLASDVTQMLRNMFGG